MAIQRYFDIFKDVGDVFQQFQQVQDGEHVLFAVYEDENYEGSAFVLFKGTDRKLYEVNGGHCSCYGLEG